MLIANRYEATGAASWGGMAEVHTFKDNHLNRLVVLKRIINSADNSRLLDEQKALLTVRSRHVVELLDIVEYDYLGVPERGLILEYIQGTDLVEGSMIAGPEHIKVLWQIASGLSDIHDAGVIHRDIKPQNIRVDARGVIKIIDFGLARQVGVDDKTLSVIGSMGYIAPELSALSAKEFTPAVDVYAFGVTATALVLPIVSQIASGCLASVPAVLSGADQRLIEILDPCVSDNPSARPSIKVVRDRLAALILEHRHRAWLNNGGALTEVNAAAPNAKINAGVGSIEIDYTGTDFIVSNFAGAVNINNMPLHRGQRIPSSCVIIFGMQGARSRAFVTFDASNPEVVP